MSRSTTPIDAYVGARITARRTALGLSQGALGQRLGVTFQQVQKYENGSNRVSAGRLHAIATVLGASIADFFPETSPTVSSSSSRSEDHAFRSLRLMTATADGRLVAETFPVIADPSIRQAVARIVRALAPAA